MKVVRRLLAIAATVALAGLTAQPAAALGNQPPQTVACTPVAHLALQYSPAAVDASSDVPCSSNSATTTGSPAWNIPPDGTNCSHQEAVLATLTSNGNMTTISWVDPRNGPASVNVPTAVVNADIGPTPPGQQQFLLFPFQGAFQNGTCQGRYTASPCPHLFNANQVWLALPACMAAFPIPIGGPLPPGFIQPFVIDLEGQLQKLINPGSIATTPSLAGLAWTTSCFWLQGTTLPADEWFQLVIIGPDDIIYTLRIDLSLRGVNWQFDDPKDPSNTLAASLPAECTNGGQQLVGHTYTQRSDKGPEPDGTFHVAATIDYGIQAWQYWHDGLGNWSLPVDLGAPGDPANTLDVPVPAHPFTVMQEEGVPVGR